MKGFIQKGTFISISIFILVLATFLFYAGCQSKKEEAKSPEKTTQAETNNTQTTKENKKVESEPVKKPAAKEEKKIPDITGTWTGKFDSRATTLNITSQDSTSFKGKITIHYRQVINQEVKGTFNPNKLTLNMSDQLHSRYMGKYAAKLSPDMKKMTGTFTLNVDKKNLNFNLTKK
jgi:PBP1b-binding outer membrane lipoprotein LpoB